MHAARRGGEREREHVTLAERPNIEPPARRIIDNRWPKLEPGTIAPVDVKGYLSQRQRQAHAAGLDVRLLERPQLKEASTSPAIGQSRQRLALVRGEHVGRQPIDLEPALGMLHVHAHVMLEAQRAGHQPVGVRDVEANARLLALWQRPTQLRAPVQPLLEAELAWLDARQLCELSAQQRVRQHVAVTVALEVKPLDPRALGVRQQSHAPGHSLRIGQRRGPRVVNPHAVRLERGDHARSLALTAGSDGHLGFTTRVPNNVMVKRRERV
nr:4'-phosphopantetheinyltransferase 9N [uncultured bacterium]